MGDPKAHPRKNLVSRQVHPVEKTCNTPDDVLVGDGRAVPLPPRLVYLGGKAPCGFGCEMLN